MEPVRDDTPGTTENPVVLPAKEARQGSFGMPVMNVLLAGLALVVVAFLVVYFLVPTTGGPG